jgi:polysaccharide export outer membrane protein
MIRKRLGNSKIIFLITVVSMLLFSCIPQKKLTYLQAGKSFSQDSAASSNVERSYKLKPKDEIYIKIHSIDPKTYQFFNGDEGVATNNTMSSDLALYLNSYMLDDSGSIVIPVAGTINLAGLTLFESKMKLEEMLKKYLSDVSVTIKLTGFRITILGEIKSAGKHVAYVTQMNILEAIALGGDLTEYGNREKIMVIREVNGKQSVFFINLLDRNLLNSNQFNLLPNDIIYIEALKEKSYGFAQFPYGIVFSSISTIFAFYAILKN